MRLQLAVAFSTGSNEIQGGYMSESWAFEAAERLRKRVAKIEVKEKVLLEKRNLLEEQGPNLWMGLCEAVKQKCLDLNRDYGSVVVRVKDTVSNQLSVRFELEGTITDLTINFHVTSSERALSWGYSSVSGGQYPQGGLCSLFVDLNGRVGFMQTHLSRTPENLAENMLSGLIGE
jgi:hypothetical protein